MKRLKLFAVAVLLLCCAATPSVAQTPATTKMSPETWLMNKGQNLIRALSENNTKTRYLKLKSVAKDVFHQKELPRLAMGRYWNEMSPAQQEALRGLFFDYFVVSYASSSFGFESVKINVLEKRPAGKDILLKTKVDVLFGEEAVIKIPDEKNNMMKKSSSADDRKANLEMYFALREGDNGYYLRDAKIEGQSILMFLRNQMEKEYQAASYSPDTFVENLRKKVQTKYRVAEEMSKIQK